MTGSVPGTAVEQLLHCLVEVIAADVVGLLQETIAQLQKKKLVVEKLGKIRGVLSMLNSVGKAISDVRALANLFGDEAEPS